MAEHRDTRSRIELRTPSKRRPRWSALTREDVLLRCLFQCTWPGCNRLAADLHHVALRSHGGSDESNNLIGLCKPCHRRVHAVDTADVFDEKLGWIKPIEAARYWLARQLEECPVRLDPIRRNVLFEEVEAAVTSIDNMNHHSEAIYDSNYWCNYEVFLKAAWRYLNEHGEAHGGVGAVILLKLIQLYRRRPGKVYHRAATGYLQLLRQLIGTRASGSHRWLDGVATYEEAYMRFLLASAESSTEMIFQKSVEEEGKYGRPLGVLVSLAQSQVVAIRRAGSDHHKLAARVRTLSNIRDRLAAIGGPLAASWVESSVPIFLAYTDIVLGRPSAAIDSLGKMAESGNIGALWYRGVALIRAGAIDPGVHDLEQARRGFYQRQRAEGRGALLVALGDAYQLARRPEEARMAYSEAARQPSHMDNSSALQVARGRLSEGSPRISSPSQIYCA